MTIDLLHNTEEKMRTAVGILKKDLATIRTGRANPALLEHVRVDYGGLPMSLNQLAAISTPAAGLLVIQPWDKSSLSSIEKAIQKSDLGLNPTSDGNVIRINIPPLSEERRQELAKVVHGRVEKEKVVIRNLRRETMDELRKQEKDKAISQDELKRALDQLQKITDVFTADADKVGQDKQAELREV
jgi:ribosome recycling factor